MQITANKFLAEIRQGNAQIGCWVGFADANVAEALAGCGFDWLLLDGEHAPNDVPRILEQLQGVASAKAMLGHSAHPVARVPVGDTALIKQYLDLGIQTLLVPMVDTAEQATAIVRDMRYPPTGVRGMGGARASRWGRIANYANEANEQVCLLVQAESQLALDNIEAIGAVDGVHGIFIGPADLSASLGYVGNSGHPEVQKVIDETIRRIVKTGKAAGILTPDETLARHYLELGATFVAVGLDNNLLMRATSTLAAKFKTTAAPAPSQQGKTY